MSLYSIKACFIVTAPERIAAKYYTNQWPTLAEQRSFENKVVSQHSQNSTDAVIVGDALALYKVNNGTYFCIIGSIDENPYILESALDALHQAISTLVRGITDRRTLLENLDYVVLVIDEVIDDG